MTAISVTHKNSKLNQPCSYNGVSDTYLDSTWKSAGYVLSNYVRMAKSPEFLHKLPQPVQTRPESDSWMIYYIIGVWMFHLVFWNDTLISDVHHTMLWSRKRKFEDACHKAGINRNRLKKRSLSYIIYVK